MNELRATADLRGERVALALSLVGASNQVPSLRVLRRRSSTPKTDTDGLVVLDLADLFTEAGELWPEVARTRYLAVNAVAEGGLVQAEVTRFAGPDGGVRRVVVRAFDEGEGELRGWEIDDVSRVVTSGAGDQIFHRPGGGAEVLAGTIAIAGRRVTWTPAGEEDVSVDFDFREEQTTRAAVTGTEPYHVSAVTLSGDETIRGVEYEQSFNPDTGEWTHALSIDDGERSTKEPRRRPDPDLPPLRELFTGAGVPWPQVVRARYFVAGPPLPEQAQADVTIFAGAGGEPRRVVVRVLDPVTGALRAWAIEDVSRLVTSGGVTTVLRAPGGGAEVPAGTIAITAGQLTWTPAGGAPATAAFDTQDEVATRAEIVHGAPYRVRFVTTLGQETVRVIDYERITDPVTSAVTITSSIDDLTTRVRGLTPHATYCYAAFSSGVAGAPPDLTASVMATARYGSGDLLYRLLPEAHRYHDEPEPAQAGRGQLRRFLQIFGAGLDLARSTGEGLRTLHDVIEVDAVHLPRLARWIGWEHDRTIPEELQRADLLFAPDVFATVGTLPNLRALVNRATGWECHLKEFVDNVFLTNAVEPVRLWQIYQATSSGGAFSAPSPQPNLYPPASEPAITQANPEAFDGRPAPVRGAAGAMLLFWHANRSAPGKPDRRRLWMQRLDGGDPAPIEALGGPVPDGAGIVDESPAALFDGAKVWLFWSSNREGSFNLWARTFTGTPPVGDTPVRLTRHAAGDRRPAAAREASGRLWVFFESDRRGPRDIWAIHTTDGVRWDTPRRITSGDPRDQMPAAALDPGGALRLFWSADRGDHSVILESRLTGDAWSDPPEVRTPPQRGVRNESPAAVVWNGALWLFWCSNRDGRFRLWAQSQTGTTWSAPAPVLGRISNDREPAPVVDGANTLRLFFSSQEGGARFRSRTVDTASPAGQLALASMGTRGDRLHYTYDAGRAKTDWYAREGVGIYLKVPPGGVDASPTVASARAFVAPFRPVHARLIWFAEQADGSATVVDADG